MNTGQDQNPFIIPLAGGALALALIQMLAVAASLINIPMSQPIAIGILLLAVFAFAFWVVKKTPSTSKHHEPNQYFLYIGIAMLLTYVLLWFLAIVSPDLSWDGNAYHIPPISMWAQEGRIHWIDTPYLEPLMNGYPKGAESITYVWVSAFGNSMLNTVNLFFLPLGILGIASISHSLGARNVTALLAGFAYLLVPVNLNQMTTTYVDAAFASSSVAMIAIWLFILKKESISSAWSIPYGAALGLSLSIKSTGIALGGLSLLILVAHIVVKSTVRRRIQHPGSGYIRRSIISILAAFLAMMLIGGFWYIRNFHQTGSPLYPIGLSSFGNQIFPGVTISEAIHEDANTPERIASLPDSLKVIFAWLQDISNWPRSIRGYDSRLAGMGYLWLIGCLPAIVIVGIDLIRKKAPNLHLYASLALLVIPVFLLTPMNWWSRYTFWIYSLGLPAFALVLGKWDTTPLVSKRKVVFTRLWLGLCVLIAAFEGLFCMVDAVALATPDSIFKSPTSVFRAETWKWSANYFFPETAGTVFDDSIEQDDIVAISPRGMADFTMYTSLVGELSQPIGKRTLLFIDQQISSQEIMEKKIDRVFWDKSFPLPDVLIGFPREEVSGFLVITPE